MEDKDQIDYKDLSKELEKIVTSYNIVNEDKKIMNTAIAVINNMQEIETNLSELNTLDKNDKNTFWKKYDDMRFAISFANLYYNRFATGSVEERRKRFIDKWRNRYVYNDVETLAKRKIKGGRSRKEVRKTRRRQQKFRKT